MNFTVFDIEQNFVEREIASIGNGNGIFPELEIGNYRIITRLDQLPTPVNDRIQLPDSVTYLIVGSINLGDNILDLGEATTLLGVSPESSILIGNPGGAGIGMIQSEQHSFAIRNITLQPAVGTLALNCFGVAAVSTCSIRNVRFGGAVATGSIGTLNLFKDIRFEEVVVENCQSGIVLENLCEFVLFQNCLFKDPVVDFSIRLSDTFLTALIHIGGCSFISNGTRNSLDFVVGVVPNLLDDSLLISGSSFTGTGTAINGFPNYFSSPAVKATSSIGILPTKALYYSAVTGNAADTTFGEGARVPIVSNAIVQSQALFEDGLASHIIYTGTNTIRIQVTLVVFISGAVSVGDVARISLEIDGIEQLFTRATIIIGADNYLISQGIYTLNNAGTIRTLLQNTSTANPVNVRDYNLSIREI